MHDLPAITREILGGYALHPGGYHGVIHWARVLENGLRIAEATGADREVVTLFALFHDSRRVNDGRDPAHGRRGGDLARSLRGRLVHLDDARFDLLYEACRLHTDGGTVADETIMACWDADRLDLGRVGITPHPRYLCTDTAKGLIGWADGRATAGHVPAEVLAGWGIDPHVPSGGAGALGGPGTRPYVPGLDRFVRAQSATFDAALAEIRAGRKEGHWMWFVFPQIAGLGRSGTSRHYAIRDLAEARAFLDHPVLGPRLVECCKTLLDHKHGTAADVFGQLDAMKLRSSATLFALSSGAGSVFERVLEHYYDGEPDALTIGLVGQTG